MEHTSKIKKWDDVFCGQHVINMTNNISNIFIKNNIESISYIDVGANVGKVFDFLSSRLKINNCVMFEASPILFKYMAEKYKNYPNIQIYNKAVSDIEGFVYFNQDSMLYQIENSENNLNFGLSQISNCDSDAKVESIMISKYISSHPELLNNIDFIKIDTETVDINILNDLESIIDLFNKKPMIEFEINYYINGMSRSDAQQILNKYLKHGYNYIDLENLTGDGLLIPEYLLP